MARPSRSSTLLLARPFAVAAAVVFLLVAGPVTAGGAWPLGAARPAATPARPTMSPAAALPRATRPTTTGATGATGYGWRAPLPGPLRVVRPFAPPATRYGPGHRGVDLAAPAGTPVVAAGDGVVSYAGLLAGRGVVAVVHGRLRTTYEPVDPLVRVGQRVRAGQALGRLRAGHPGCTVAACLHWGLLDGPVYLDPLELLRPAPPRLLPLAIG